MTDQITAASRKPKLVPQQLLMQVWYLLNMKFKLEAPVPIDLPFYRTEANAHRILLFGNGPTHGWGVFSHNFALTGQLGLIFEQYYNHPVNIDYVGDELMNLSTAKDWLADVDLTVYDQVIFCLGWNDAMRLTDLDDWEAAYTALLTNARGRMRAAASLVITGIEPAETALGYTNFGSRIVRNQVVNMNTRLEDLAANYDAGYAKLGPRVNTFGRPLGSAITYRAWAKDIARVALPLLPVELPETIIPDTTQFKWIGSPYVLGFAHGNFPNQLATIEDQAKKELGTDLAQITIMEDNRQWLSRHFGPVPQSVPRHLTYCDVAVSQDEILVVPNGNADPRFKGNGYLQLTGMPFYVGTALRSRAGEVIGSFCVLGIAPRPKNFFKMTKYKRLLASAQAEIWRIEDEAIKRADTYHI